MKVQVCVLLITSYIFLDIPEFVVVSSNVNRVEGSTVKLKCLANSEPYPAIYWRKSTARTPYAIDHRYGHIQTKRDDRTIYLIFQPLKLSDAGNYTCEARNRIGTTKRDVTVAVYKKSQYPPSIVTPYVKISADINSNVTVICDVDGNPKPHVKWSKVGQDRVLSDFVMFKDEPLQGMKHRYSLIISKVQLSNAGTFQCVAGNMISFVSKEIVLQVSSKFFSYLFIVVVYLLTSRGEVIRTAELQQLASTLDSKTCQLDMSMHIVSAFAQI